MRVLVVDDSAFMRRAITRMIASDPDLEIVGTACNGREAIEQAVLLKPDVITLDIEMPEMDGLTALRLLRVKCPDPKPAVLVCSSLTTDGSHEALRAMRLGAADVIAKDASMFSATIEDMRDDLVRKVKAVGSGRGSLAAAATTRVADRFAVPDPGSLSLIAIGSSTGGPPVLETVLAKVTPDIPFPIVIAQHMPALFTRSLANRLDSACAVTITHATETMPLHPGTVYIIEGGKNGLVRAGISGRMSLRITDEAMGKLYIPSVDLLLDSASSLASRALGIVLTGMGEDGLEGGRTFKQRGGAIIAQDAASCTVYGMPRAIVDAGIADAQITPDDIACLLGVLSSPGAAARRSA